MSEEKKLIFSPQDNDFYAIEKAKKGSYVYGIRAAQHLEGLTEVEALRQYILKGFRPIGVALEYIQQLLDL